MKVEPKQRAFDLRVQHGGGLMFRVETPGATKFVLYTVVAFLLSGSAQAQFSTEAIDPANYPEYYTLDDNSRISADTNLLVAALEEFEPLHNPVKKVLLSLTSFILHNSPVPAAAEKYNRRNHFGSWRSDLSNCLDVRGRVLARDSKDPVVTRASGERCVVDSGTWHDPYTDSTVTDPAALQIDHMVPLKNAYIMGAHSWAKSKKCWYANFIAVDYHLLPVSAHENMSKSDRTPADYLPPNRGYLCAYARNWLKIKMVWELELVQPEVEALNDVIKQNSCTPSEMSIDAEELKKTRAEIAAGSSLCH